MALCDLKLTWISIIVIVIACVAWVLQLSGVASLQQVCPTDLHLSRNNVDPIKGFLASEIAFAAESAAIKASIALLPPSEQAVAANKLSSQLSAHVISAYPKLLDGIARLTSRSSTGAFVLTADTSCSEIYRYPWFTTCLQLLVLVLSIGSMLRISSLWSMRFGVCCQLAIVTVLAIENINTFFYMREHVTGDTLIRGYIYTAGCILSAICNMKFMFLLGVQDNGDCSQVDSKIERTSEDRDSANREIYKLGV